MKHSCFPAFLQEGHDLPKVYENYNCGLPKVSTDSNKQFCKVRKNDLIHLSKVSNGKY